MILLIGCVDYEYYDDKYDIESNDTLEMIEDFIIRINKTMEFKSDMKYLKGFMDCKTNNSLEFLELIDKYNIK